MGVACAGDGAGERRLSKLLKGRGWQQQTAKARDLQDVSEGEG